ncbi:transporter substrate-binding domain-containing protein [Cellvibrio sp. pealriver]|uniref:transporter substrate-binding domain-containing protein n=1 Tax=Cellvibrio sp. pealriver TaxID=1622269 RepID=UPI000B2794CB|nr:transporter substrate-binding domain-containing protein [Cellvibrio sp. pealriver]
MSRNPTGLLILLTMILTLESHAQTRLHTPALINDNDRYAFAMATLALSYVDKNIQLQADSSEEKTLPRVMSEIDSGQLDIFWTATDKDKEQDFLPVRIPLYKGMFGYRIFIIHKNNQYKFNAINNLSDLKSISLGQGRTWADTSILEANGLHVVKVSKFPSLLYMVDGQRFDAFPRGIHEPWGEIASHSQLQLAVEQRLMLSYKMPFYLFVHKNNRTLAQQLETGLNQAIADGSFDKLFYAEPGVQKVLQFANLKNRTLIELQNPYLTPETPVNRPELWLDIAKF